MGNKFVDNANHSHCKWFTIPKAYTATSSIEFTLLKNNNEKVHNAPFKYYLPEFPCQIAHRVERAMQHSQRLLFTLRAINVYIVKEGHFQKKKGVVTHGAKRHFSLNEDMSLLRGLHKQKEQFHITIINIKRC